MFNNSPLTLLIIATSLTGAVAAQVPYGFLVTAESNTAPDGFRIVDPATGHITDISEPQGNFLGGATCVAIDEGSSNAIVTSAGGSFGGAPVWNVPLTDNYYFFGSLTGQGLPLFGTLERMYATPGQTLFTLSSVSDGLYGLATISGSPTLLSNLTDATDIAVINGKAYVNSFQSGQPSTIVEVDLTSLVARTVGTGYPSIRSLGTIGGSVLLAGREDGNIDSIDIVSGTASPFLSTGLGSLIAIVDDLNGHTYFATDAGSVYDLNNPVTPVYTSPYTLTDIDVGRINQATQLIYGSGCSGSSGIPQAQTSAAPALGSTYLMSIDSAQPGIAGAVLGLGRDNVDLATVGFPGCTLVSDLILIDASVVTIGGTANTSVTIPNTPALVGTHLNNQFFVFETGGTFAMSQGIEGHIR